VRVNKRHGCGVASASRHRRVIITIVIIEIYANFNYFCVFPIRRVKSICLNAGRRPLFFTRQRGLSPVGTMSLGACISETRFSHLSSCVPAWRANSEPPPIMRAELFYGLAHLRHLASAWVAFSALLTKAGHFAAACQENRRPPYLCGATINLSLPISTNTPWSP
jgi:hypothetical protein